MGIYDYLASILGQYEPVTYQVITYNIDGTIAKVESVIPAGIAGVDILYLTNAIVLCICIYSIFRIIGGLICKIF